MKAGRRENTVLPTTFTPLSVAIIVLTSVVIPAACLWMAQPLYAARAQQANQFASEDIFWHVGPEGYDKFTQFLFDAFALLHNDSGSSPLLGRWEFFFVAVWWVRRVCQ